MKANAPEKIYLQQYDENTLIFLNKWNISDEWTNEPFNEKIATNIEYARTDAFIEKAADFLCDCIENCMGRYMETWSPEMKAKTINNFKNYMKS